MSRASAPTAILLVVCSTGQAFGAITAMNQLPSDAPVSAWVMWPLLGTIFLNIAAIVLWCAAKLSDASLDMLEQLACPDHSLELADLDGDGEISLREARAFQRRQLFLSNALAEQNRARGIGFKIGTAVVTTTLVQSLVGSAVSQRLSLCLRMYVRKYVRVWTAID